VDVKKILHGFRIFKKIATSKLTGKRIPIWTWLYVNNRCNLNCRYCFYHPYTPGKTKEYTFEQLKKIIDELCGLGCEFFTLLGGEPLLRDDIGKIVNYIKSKDKICDLVSNGLLVKEKIDQIKNLDAICLSIDGDRKANDALRGKGTHEKVMEAIDVALAYKLNVRIHGVVTRTNYNSLEYLAKLAQEKGLALTMAIPAIHSEEKDLFIKDREVKPFFKKYIRLKKKGFPLYQTYQALDYVLAWPYSYRQIIFKDELKKLKFQGIKKCLLPNYVCMIRGDGFMHPCPMRWDQYGKNVLKVGVKAAWEDMANCDCVACGDLSGNNLSMHFEMNPLMVWEVIKNYFRYFKNTT